MSENKFFCFNCLMQFTTEEEAEDHWAHTCKYGGHLAPMNLIIRPIKELPKRQAQLEKKWKARLKRKNQDG